MKSKTVQAKYYLSKIIQLFPYMQMSTIYSHKSTMKCSYKEMYMDFLDRLTTIDEAQVYFQDIRPRDLKNLPEFKGKHPSSANDFINNLFTFREGLPQSNYIDRIKRVIAQIEALKDECKNCIHYDNDLKFCGYLGCQTEKDFFCKAFERDEDL